jgi:tetratricopeptide (TPR) repeat protein
VNTPGADPLVGKLVSHYEITAKLGGGGMGIVYAAKDTRLGRLVALKFLPPQWGHDASAQQRFIREAQAASSTDHRNICTIHNIETTDDGQLFIVMAHYKGQTLKQKLEHGPLDLDEAIDIAAQIAEGLAKAHEQGIVHRDIKPGNLMITEDAVKILDFGLAKFADALQLTIPGSTLGTVAYMAPEQARGEEADVRSDVWALGVVLFQMVTGEVPFKGAYAEAISYAIRNDPPPPLSVGGRAIPEGIERVVLRALQKDLAQRFQTARELARELRLLQGRTIPLELRTEPVPMITGTTTILPRGAWKRFAGRVWKPFAATATVLVVAVGVWAWLISPAERLLVAIAPMANHTGDPELEGYRLALTERLISELSDSRSIRVIPYFRLLEIIRRYMSRAEDISSRDAIHAIATQSEARLIVIPTVENRGGRWLGRAEFRRVQTGTTVGSYETEAVTSALPKEAVYRVTAWLANGIQEHFGPGGIVDSALARLNVGMRVRRRIHQLLYARTSSTGPFRSVDAARAFEQGLNEYEQMEYSSALAWLRRVVLEDSQHAMSHAWTGRVLLTLNQMNEAVGEAQRAKQLTTGETSPRNAAFINAVLAESRGDPTAAEEAYRNLTLLAPDEPATHLELADFLKRRNDRDQEAVNAYHDVLRLDSRYVRPHVDLCQLYNRIDDNPLAEKHAQTALERYRAAGNRSGEAQALLCLGDAQREQGGNRLVDARRNIESARDIFESLRQPYNLSRAYQYLGTIEASARNYRAAAGFFEEALSRSRKVANRQIEAVVLFNLGVIHEQLGERAQVLNYYQQSRELYQQIGDERRAAEQEVNTANLLVNYGRNQAEALRRLANTRTTLQKFGHVEFEVIAMQAEAVSLRNAGRHAEALKQLRQALSIATERRLSERTLSIVLDMADSYILQNEYELARTQLENILATDAGREDPGARIALGRVYVRLGDFDTARRHLEQALARLEAVGRMRLAPIVHTSLGELAYESGKLQEARGHFEKSAAFWVDDLVDTASLEARCYLGLIDSLVGKSAGRVFVEASVEQARSMGRLSLEARCRMYLARIHIAARRYADALATLRDIPPEGEKRIGPELEAQVRYWRGRALSENREADRARLEAEQARRLILALRQSVPEQYRGRFSLRNEIRPLIP